MFEEENRFPMKFEQCPACGSEERVCQIVKESEIKRGLLKNKDLKVAVARSVIPVADPQEIGSRLTIPIVVAFYDICAKCGCYYAIEVDVQSGLVGQQNMPRPGGGPLIGGLFGNS